MGKIPSQAKRVFKGMIFDVYQWEQEMFDGTAEIFEMLKRPDTVEVITIVGDKILIQEQEQPGTGPFLCLPGGRCDEGEDPLAAAKRELLEETGYSSEEWELWDSLEPYHKMEWTIYWYIARDCKKVREPQLDAGEKISTRLISFEELLELSDNPKVWGREMVAKILRMRLDPKKVERFRKRLFG